MQSFCVFYEHNKAFLAIWQCSKKGKECFHLKARASIFVKNGQRMDDDDDFVPVKRFKSQLQPAIQTVPCSIFVDLLESRIQRYTALKSDIEKIFSICTFVTEATYIRERNRSSAFKAVKGIEFDERDALLSCFLDTHIDNMQLVKRDSDDPKRWCLLVKATDRYPKITFASRSSIANWGANDKKGRTTGQYQASHIILSFFTPRQALYDCVNEVFASHLCHNSNCCNPLHIEWADRSLNTIRQQCNEHKSCLKTIHNGKPDCIF